MSIAGAGLLSAVVLVISLYWSARFALSDFLARTDTASDLNSACTLNPWNASYRLRLADQLDEAGKDPRHLLAQAHSLDPKNASILMRLGLQAELRGDLPAAEAFLLNAAQLSHLYDPRWTLANYYFRRGDPRFWEWAKRALLVSHGNAAPLFRLCWEMSSNNADVVLYRAILPGNALIYRDYLEFLNNTSPPLLDAARPIAHMLLKAGEAHDTPLLLHYIERLIKARSGVAAEGIWNGLCERGWIQYQVLNPAKGAVVENGKFERIPLDAGFDWRLGSIGGIALNRFGNGLLIEFSGKQPEDCEFLWQVIRLVKGQRYELQYRYSSANITRESGVSWKITDVATGAEIGVSPVLQNGTNNMDHWSFSSSQADTALLKLCYRRAPGTTRIEGSIGLQDVSIGKGK